MQTDLVGMICKMGIFMICAQAIVHFRPKASYEKYLRLLVSAMLLAQVLLFVGGFFSSKGKEELREQIQQFTHTMEKNIFFTEEKWKVEIMGEEEPGGQTEPSEIRIAPMKNIRMERIQVESIQIGSVE